MQLKTLFYMGMFLVLASLSFAHLDPYAPQAQPENSLQGTALSLPRYGYTDAYTAMTTPRTSYLNGVVSPYPSTTYLKYCDNGKAKSQVVAEAAFVFPYEGHFADPHYILDAEEMTVEHQYSALVGEEEAGEEYTVVDEPTWHNEIEYSQDIHHYTDLYQETTNIDDETQVIDHYYESIDPISPERFKRLSLADQFEYRQGHHRLYSQVKAKSNVQPCYSGAFVHTLEERQPRIDFLPGNEMRGARKDFNVGPMEMRNRPGFTPGEMEMRNRPGFTPGDMEMRNRPAFTPGPMEMRNRGGLIPGPMESRERPGFTPGPMELRPRDQFTQGPMEMRNRDQFGPGSMNMPRVPQFIPVNEMRNPKNGFAPKQPCHACGL